MKSPIIAYTGWFLLLAVFGFYGYGIVNAIWLSLGNGSAKDYPAFLLTTIGSIQALLLTNLGVLLGISITKPDSGVARQLMMQNTRKVIPPPTDPMELKVQIQLFALVIYVISLVACLVTWIIKGFIVDDQIISIIPESAKMFVGVVLAYLTAVLGIKGTNNETK
jgi:hypothetical protein